MCLLQTDRQMDAWISIFAMQGAELSVSRVYADVVANMPPEYADYDAVDIKWEYASLDLCDML